MSPTPFPSLSVTLRQEHRNALSAPERHHLEGIFWSLDLAIAHALPGPPSLAHAVDGGQRHHGQGEAHHRDRSRLRNDR